jgi:hypothetical protein
MTKRTLHLTTGTYTPKQAEELLIKNLHNEMNFHKLQNFTSVIRFDEDSEQACNNHRLLQQREDLLKQLLAHAEESGMHLQIESKIHITLVEDEGAKDEKVETASAVEIATAVFA